MRDAQFQANDLAYFFQKSDANCTNSIGRIYYAFTMLSQYVVLQAIESTSSYFLKSLNKTARCGPSVESEMCVSGY